MFGTTSGGAITMTELPAIKSEDNFRIFEGNTFTNCQGVTGGAIYIYDVSNVLIGQGNKFIGNRANHSGGAIKFECPDWGEETWKCSMTIDGGNSFSNNQAKVQGGAIDWNFYEPLIKSMDSIEFANNKAGVYGHTISSVA